MKQRSLLFVAMVMATSVMFAQLRPTDKDGINVFETPKTETEFTGLNVKLGGALALPFSMLDHSNTVTRTPGYAYNYDSPAANSLVPLTAGFGLPQANLYVKSNLSDGVYLNFELYLASRHHNETWVKGGFLQFDKMPFLPFEFVDNIMKHTTLKVGQFDVNYGDAHFRRSDGGMTMYNPFMENHILDEFSTEIGVEADVHLGDFIVVGSVTNGKLNNDLTKIDNTRNATKHSNGKHNPAWIGKLAYDKQFSDQFRARASVSGYYTAGSVRNTLLSGDRTGSNYYGVMYNVGPGTSTYTNGRFSPGMSHQVSALMGNLFLKYSPVEMVSIESFTTIENISGRAINAENPRKANQFVTDLVVRFGADEDFFVGGRYNTMNAEMGAGDNAYTADINRVAISAGWFMTKNIMAKLEYVKQNYNGFPTGTIQDGAEFNGLTLQGSIAF